MKIDGADFSRRNEPSEVLSPSVRCKRMSDFILHFTTQPSRRRRLVAKRFPVTVGAGLRTASNTMLRSTTRCVPRAPLGNISKLTGPT